MKNVILYCFVFLLSRGFAEADLWLPPTLDDIANSDSVYLVKLSSINRQQNSPLIDKMTFSVIEVLRGKKLSLITLVPDLDAYRYKENVELILYHDPDGVKNTVGWPMKGPTCEWHPITVTGDDNRLTAEEIGPIDKVRQYLQEHPYKH